MNLAILGGTGRTGRLLVDLALQDGHDVRVLARDPSKVHRTHERLTVVQGDARDPQAIARLVEGADAVLSALGPVRGGPRDVMTSAAQALVSQLATAPRRRLITLTGAGVPHEGDRPGAVDRIFGILLRLLQPDVLRDSQGHVDLVRGSNLDWTVVRAPRLTDGPERPLRVGLVGDISPQLTRASAARFMLDQVASDRYVRQAPAISN
ncbi:NAD(P)-dependent oxidoreductase [Deinococcus pimensis]|uniref:NAD(P)-dependent oxidoreductase n=1 Tax=Deinococcus pimensis TaxID=309888 RepID=UPI00048433C8|nr:NAD(P)H-binding protein [Deinococcus pimensis]